MWKTQDVHPAVHGMSHCTFACRPAGNTLLASPEVRKIGFTGSTNVGKMLMKQAADTVKKVGRAEWGLKDFVQLSLGNLRGHRQREYDHIDWNGGAPGKAQ